MNTRLRIVIAIVALAVAGGAAWYGGLLDRFGLGHDERQGLTLYGNVDIRQVELGFRVSGRLAEMRVEEGDTVKAGDIIAVLDRKPFEDTLRRAEAGVAAAEADIAERRATLLNARRVLDRRKKLITTGAVSAQSYDDARAAYREAQARLNSAKAQLVAAEADTATSRTALGDTELRAPANGIVLSRVREPGAILATGATVYTLSLTRPVWVQVYVAEPDLGRIHTGMATEVTTDAEPHHPFKGQVGFISPVAEFTPKSVETPELRSDLVYRVRIVVDAPGKGLLQGMPVTVRLPDAAPRTAGK